MEPEELIAELENKHTGEALSIDEYSRIFAALREYKRVLDKARMVVAAVELAHREKDSAWSWDAQQRIDVAVGELAVALPE